MTPHVLVLRAPGTNCDRETAFAFELAGATTSRVHVNRLLERPALLGDFQILCIPGGFSYGDDVAAGRILATEIRHHLGEHFAAFRDAGKLILGICNGFQTLIKSGLLLPEEQGRPAATLTWNDSARFEDRWVDLSVSPSSCVFLRGIERMYLPVAHAEGKFVARDAATLADLDRAGLLPLRYAAGDSPDRDKSSSQSRSETKASSLQMAARPGSRNAAAVLEPAPAVPYPENPNGAWGDVAGVCDASGRVFGLMPHPERHIDPTQHPRWTRMERRPESGDGLAVFKNAVAYFRA